jgi:hypothetical protein
MPDPLTFRVDQFGDFMSEDDFNQAIQAMDGSLAQDGNDFTIINVIAPDPGRARKAFVDAMANLLGESDNVLIWRYKPEIGTRREGANIVWVCTARFRIEESGQPVDEDAPE